MKPIRRIVFLPSNHIGLSTMKIILNKLFNGSRYNKKDELTVKGADRHEHETNFFIHARKNFPRRVLPSQTIKCCTKFLLLF